MIDLHCHILPGVDDGSPSLESSLDMARMAAAEGVTTIACTPHFYPGVYDNDGPSIKAAVETLQQALLRENIPISLVCGGDVHIAPGLVASLKQGRVLSLNDTRYVLVETPHHILPPRAEHIFFDLLAAGYMPILTHPERMTWIEQKYDVIRQLFRSGVWMQLTAGSITGQFGRRPRYWAERMLEEGMTHLIASDAHDCVRRPPGLTAAFEAASKTLGEAEAANLVLHRPALALRGGPPSDVPAPDAGASDESRGDDSVWRRLTSIFGGG